MKNKLLAFAVFMSAAAFSHAQHIASVDMEVVIMSHPKTEGNKDTLLTLKDAYESQINDKKNEIQAMFSRYQTLAAEARSDVLSAKLRQEKAEEAMREEARLRQKDAEMQKLASELQFRLQRQEVEFMAAIVEDIAAKVKTLSEQLNFDLVVDSSAMRASAPIPLIMYASDAIDVTDKIIEMTGGKRVEKPKAAPEAKAEEAKK